MCFRGRNWGDALNVRLVQTLSGKRPITIDLKSQYRLLDQNSESSLYLVVGSTLQYAERHTVVWGAGFIAQNSQPAGEPRAVRAVRGPLSRAKLLESGIACPDIFGDPALLLPMFVRPRISARYRLGLIPHYCHRRDSELRRIGAQPGVRILNVFAGTAKLVRDALQCAVIGSSSLHGLILADAYGLPSVWLRFGQALQGSTFKFEDYYASIGAHRVYSFDLTPDVSVHDILRAAVRRSIRLDLTRLLGASPFAR